MAETKVTPSEISNKYVCIVNLTSDYLNIAQNALTRVPFNSVAYDPGSCWVATPDFVYSVPVSGYYIVNARVLWKNITVNENIIANIRVSGTSKAEAGVNIAQVAYGQDVGLNAIVYAAAGQYIELVTLHDGAGSTQDIAGSGCTYMHIALIAKA